MFSSNDNDHIQRKNKLQYSTTKSENENEQPVLYVHVSDTADKDNTPTVKRTNHTKVVTRKMKTCTVVPKIVADWEG